MRRLVVALVVIACDGHEDDDALDEVPIAASCVDGGDPNEDVDAADAGRRYTPRAIPPSANHDLTIVASPSSIGGARIRSRLIFEAADLRNVLGVLPSALRVRAAGPMKNSTFSAGLGYAIQLVDPEQRRCRGFVSASVVTIAGPASAW
jgi:hypothetical protein